MAALCKRFPSLRLSKTTLWRIYKKHGIKFKFIKRGKREINYAEVQAREVFDKMHKQVSLAREQGTKLIFIDETVFTFKTFANKAWGLPYKALTVPEEKLAVQT